MLIGALVGDAAGGTLEFIGRRPTHAEVTQAMTMCGGRMPCRERERWSALRPIASSSHGLGLAWNTRDVPGTGA